jgi:hypothetical protein
MAKIWGKHSGIGLMDFLDMAPRTATQMLLDAEINATLAV